MFAGIHFFNQVSVSEVKTILPLPVLIAENFASCFSHLLVLMEWTLLQSSNTYCLCLSEPACACLSLSVPI